MTAAVNTVVDYPAAVGRQAVKRLKSEGFEAWHRQAEGCGYCARPVRLVGRSQTVDTSTGQVLSSYDSGGEPDGVTYVRCGNRRAAVCPSCSREYAGDTFHLIRAGTAGGDKGVPESVRTHPKVFATLTAPSFGAVHVRRRPGQTGSQRCRPRSKKELCSHGRPLWCMAIHDEHDSRTGQPLCADCYDYESHVVWQWWAPELWRRFTITLRRMIAARLGLSEAAARRVVTMPFGKITEYQLRGAVHFHGVLRLDGPRTAAEPYPAPIVDLDAEDLAQLARDAAAFVHYDAAPVDGCDVVRRLRFGAQVDARPITTRLTDGEELTEEAVAGYLAKYVTKATDDLDPGGNGRNAHIRRLSKTVEELAARALIADGQDSPYALLGKYPRTLGYRGHCATKSRTFSTTMTALRGTRRRFARRAALARRGITIEVGVDLGADEDSDTTEVLGTWRYAGMGWQTEGDAALAAMAADAARDYARLKSARGPRSRAALSIRG